jgi:hypothetical protein
MITAFELFYQNYKRLDDMRFGLEQDKKCEIAARLAAIDAQRELAYDVLREIETIKSKQNYK